MSDIHNIAVIGAGSWGTALAACALNAGRHVTLYARDAGLAETINTRHENDIYLKGHKLDGRLRATADLKKSVQNADLVLLVTPAQFMRTTLTSLRPHLPAYIPLVNACKGIEMATGKMPAAIAAEMLPQNPYAVLSGPTFATEVVAGLPAAATLATAAPRDKGVGWAASLSSRMFRLYFSDDPVGAEACGALKNVVAIACGIVEGKKFGQNARAAVMTRGLAETRRFGVTRGAKPESFLGLAGVGDMMLTCNSMTSRNFSLGVELGSGKKLADILAARRTVAEGVSTARAVAAIAERENIDMPICRAVDDILHGSADIDAVIHALLSRDVRDENI